jgi:glycosyltransferase involved in cell wall biosynthesis
VDDDRKTELLRRSWVHVLPSAKEGWGLTVLEAGACATPSVVSDSPGLRDAVPDGTGIRVPHGDVPALAEALRRILEDDALRADLGRGAREFALRHGWDRAADLTERHLERHAGKETR